MTAEKLHAIAEELNEEFVGRDEHIVMTMVALLARAHSYWMGPPGVAKTALAEAICSRITGANYFAFAFDKSVAKEEIFGHYDLGRANRENQWVRHIENALPSAHVAFGDELCEGSASVLNTLRSPLLERTFRNGDAGVIEMPLISFIAASNAPLDTARHNLGALTDRFLVHLVFDPLQASSELHFLLRLQDQVKADRTTIDLAELQLAIADVIAVAIPDEIRTDLVDLYSTLTIEHEVPISNRRLAHSQRLLQAHAYLHSREEVTRQDLGVLQHCFWLSPEHRDIVRIEVLRATGSKWALAQLAVVKNLRDRLAHFVGRDADRVNLALTAMAELQPIRAALVDQDKSDPVVATLHTELTKVLVTAMVAAGYDAETATRKLRS